MPPPTQREKTNQEKARAIYLASFLETCGDETAAARESGLTDPRTRLSLAKLLRETYGLADRPRPGRPRKYAVQHCAAAQERILSGPTPVMSAAQLVGDLQAAGSAPADACPEGLTRNLRQHLASQDLSLAFGERSTTLGISKEQASGREEWCVKYLPTFSDPKELEACVVVDETTVEESPHPKSVGECGPPSSVEVAPPPMQSQPKPGNSCFRMSPAWSFRMSLRAHPCCSVLSMLGFGAQQGAILHQPTPTLRNQFLPCNPSAHLLVAFQCYTSLPCLQLTSGRLLSGTYLGPCHRPAPSMSPATNAGS